MIIFTRVQLYQKIIFAAALFCALGFPYANAAPDDLVVEFEQTPLFNEANFMPGTVVNRTVRVTNHTGSAKDIVTEAINMSDSNGFGDVLQMTIKEGASTIFNDTLTKFFNEGELALSQVASGVSTTYEFLVSFESSANNAYQEKSLGFDILVGFEGDQSGGGDNPPQGGGSQGNGGGGGGGGGSGDSGGNIRGLTITGESTRAIEIESTAATIEWDTSYRSTSRVVYGTTPGLFNFSSSPNYGYPFSTAEFDTPASPNGVLHHIIHISGLTPNTTYYYRTISHASPDTISFEHDFKTGDQNKGGKQIVLGGSPAETNAISQEPDRLTLQNRDRESAPTGLVAENSAQISEPPMSAGENDSKTRDTKTSSSFFASIFTALPFSRAWDIILLIIAMGIVFFLIRWFSRRNKSRSSN